MRRPSPARRGMSLSELLVVLALLGTVSGIAWPTLSGAWRRAQVGGAARELVSTLALARGLSVGRVDGRVYGVVFEPSGRYRVWAFAPGAAVTAENLATLGAPYGEPVEPDPAVRFEGFPETGAVARLVVFRDDGIPTADGLTFPAPEGLLVFHLVSEAAEAEARVVLNRAAGTARAE